MKWTTAHRERTAVRLLRWAPAFLLAALIQLLVLPGCGEAAMSVSVPEEVIRPGLAVVIRYTLPEAGECDLVLRSEEGTEVSVICKGHMARAGENSIFWNGTYNGIPAPEGTWRLCLEKDGASAETPVVIGRMAPYLVGVNAAESSVVTGAEVTVTYFAVAPGILQVLTGDGDSREKVAEKETEAGDGSIAFPVSLPAGQHTLMMVLTDGEGISSAEYPFTVTVLQAEPEEPAADPAAEEKTEEKKEPEQAKEDKIPKTLFTPSHTSPYEGQDPTANYWTTPMDITDEEAVWAALTAPMTVIDNGKGEKAQIILRSEPSAESEGVGSITCETQGVHVLERGEEWSLVECYSSSFHDSAILNWNALVQGYVLTGYLKEVIPNQNLGYVVDKLTQRLYVFRDGHLYSTLLVSTGLSNPRQPYNETRSGEFLMISRVGTFQSDNLVCSLGIRFNKGDLIHEVPHTENADGSSNYKSCESKLGTKASHGCIRVQRKRSPEGVDMAWIWNNYKKNTRLIIWEDWQGRQIEIPSDDSLLYYNPRGGRYYHSQEHCNSVNRAGLTFRSFPYGELDQEPYADLLFCEYCTPALRRAQIEEINRIYAEGGDHDPVMTEARKTCPRSLR